MELLLLISVLPSSLYILATCLKGGRKVSMLCWRRLENKLMGELWIIHLFDVDFNFNSKWLGQAILKQAEALQLVADEQYDSW